MIVFIISVALWAIKPCWNAHIINHTSKRSSVKWDYGSKGPSTWPKHSPQCKGANQSPINIMTKCNLISATYKNYVNRTNYVDKPGVEKYDMINNGHTLEIKIPVNTTYELRKGGDLFVPTSVHIHFDPISGEGSEHTINGKKYFAEIHIVHRNKKYIEKDIHNHPDIQISPLLVVAIFVEQKKDDKKRTLYGYEEEYRSIMGLGTSFAIDIISSESEKLRKPGSKTTIDAFPLEWLFPTNKREGAIYDYVNYHGSLTTPPCLEVVDWIVFTGKTLITDRDTARKMRRVLDNTGKQMAGNNRPVQDVNGRKLYGVKGGIV